MKTCSKCKATKQTSEFHRDGQSPDGVTRQCKVCRNTKRAESAKANPEYELARSRRYNAENADKKLAYRLSDQGRQKRRDWYKTPAGRAFRRLKHQKNPAAGRIHRARRRARLARALPAWADVTAITQFYNSCPKTHEVDHIVPLAGDNACGLHVLENLQYLPKSENRAKGARVTDVAPFPSCQIRSAS